MFVKHVMDKEVLWLIGMVLEFIWEEKVIRKKNVKLEHLIGHVKLKYKANSFLETKTWAYSWNLVHGCVYDCIEDYLK